MPRPGDYILVQGHSLIDLGIQAVTEGAFNHAAIATGYGDDQTVIEAVPGGVREAPLSQYERYAVWTNPQLRYGKAGDAIVAAARSHIGDQYAFAEDAGFLINAIRKALGKAEITALWTQHGHIYCSGLVDACCAAVNMRPRPDRPKGYLSPVGLSYSCLWHMSENHGLWEP